MLIVAQMIGMQFHTKFTDVKLEFRILLYFLVTSNDIHTQKKDLFSNFEPVFHSFNIILLFQNQFILVIHDRQIFEFHKKQAHVLQLCFPLFLLLFKAHYYDHIHELHQFIPFEVTLISSQLILKMVIIFLCKIMIKTMIAFLY